MKFLGERENVTGGRGRKKRGEDKSPGLILDKLLTFTRTGQRWKGGLAYRRTAAGKVSGGDGRGGETRREWC